MDIIAEAGSAHAGDIVYARELIDAAAEAGAQFVKFQYIIADEILHKKTKPIDLFNNAVNLYERFLALEQKPEFYAELASYAASRKIRFLCTPFGLGSAQALAAIGVHAFKIASPELNHIPLLRFVNKHQLPVFASTGLARLGDIEEALTYLDACPTTLLHCVTSYPAAESDYALACIPPLRKLFSVPVGCSDHSIDPLFIPLLAQYYQATHVEKHIRLAKPSGGLDDPISITPRQLSLLCQESILFSERLKSDDGVSALNYLEKRFTKERVRKASGDGQYHLSSQEQASYYTSRRSILAQEDIDVGQNISEKNCAILRAEQQGSPGLHPRCFELILGKPVKKYIHAGEGITWNCLF